MVKHELREVIPLASYPPSAPRLKSFFLTIQQISFFLRCDLFFLPN